MKKNKSIIQKLVYCERLKQLAAIFLIALFCFNLVGYRALFHFQVQRSSAAIESKIDNGNFTEADLITVRINLNMPYQAQQTDFERIDGEIEVDGVLYKYVKRKTENGALVLKCIRDHAGTRIQSARDSFFKISNSLTQENGSKSSSSKHLSGEKPVSEYEGSYNEGLVKITGLQTVPGRFFNALALLRGISSSPERPPELI